MIIDLSSPVELRGYEIMHDDSGAARAYIDLFNVADDTITGYSATVHWKRDETGENANDYIAVDSVAIPGGGLFKLVLSCGAFAFADRLEMYFDRVSFQSGEEWTPKDGDLVDVGEFRPLEGGELDKLRQEAGEDACMFPEMQDEFWRCVCGRINPLSSEECARCRRERNYVLRELNRKALGLSEKEKAARFKRIIRSKKQSAGNPENPNNTSFYLAMLFLAILVFLTVSLLITMF